MAATLHKLAKAAPPMPPRTPLREALAKAIAEHAKWEADRAVAEAAQDPARQASLAAYVAIDAAEEAIEVAKGNAAKHLQAVARGDAGTPPQTIREARDALRDAQDAHEAAEAAEVALAADLRTLVSRTSFAADRLRAAANAVLTSEAAGLAHTLVAEVRGLQRDLVHKGLQLDWLARAGTLPMVQETFGLKIADVDVRQVVYRLDCPPRSWGEFVKASNPSAPWDAALAALMQDADAALPTT